MQARTLGRCLQEFQETLQLYQSYGLSWSYLASFTSNLRPLFDPWHPLNSTDTTQGETTSSTGNSSLDRALQWATPSTAFQSHSFGHNVMCLPSIHFVTSFDGCRYRRYAIGSCILGRELSHVLSTRLYARSRRVWRLILIVWSTTLW